MGIQSLWEHSHVHSRQQNEIQLSRALTSLWHNNCIKLHLIHLCMTAPSPVFLTHSNRFLVIPISKQRGKMPISKPSAFLKSKQIWICLWPILFHTESTWESQERRLLGYNTVAGTNFIHVEILWASVFLSDTLNISIILLGMQIIRKKHALSLPGIKQLLLHLIYGCAQFFSYSYLEPSTGSLSISFSLKHLFLGYPAIASFSCWEISMPHLLHSFRAS